MTRSVLRHAPRNVVRRVGVGFGVVGLVIACTPGTATAHGSGGPPASNFHTRVEGLAPSTPGVAVGLGPDREQLELRITGEATAIVIGYRGEPYLRVNQRGTYENLGSPTVAINRTRIPTSTTAPNPGDGATTVGPERWVRVSHSPVARWHDHRAHWMGGRTPAAIARDPGRTHVVTAFAVPIEIDGDAAAIRGDIRWEPPPESWRWLLLAGGLAAAIVFAVRWRAGTVALAAVVVLAAAETLHLWGSWPYGAGSTPDRLGDAVPSIATIGVAVIAAVWTARRGVWSAAPLLALAGLFAAAAGGLGDLDVLSHSWVPSRLPDDVTRALVVVALGGGIGVAIVGITRLRPAADRGDQSRGALDAATPAS